jgi:C1A family cysteine protease
VTPQEIQETNNAIRAAGAKWQAAETSLTKIPRAEQLKRLGFVPGPGDKSLQEREGIAKANLETFRTSATLAAGVPATYDLRNVGGQNFITPITDQGNCGSCVAFGTVATVEATNRIQRNNPNLNIDLSEAHLFYCYGRNDGRNCENGWWPDPALNHFRDNGVVDETCYPYIAGDQNCSNLCSDWNNRLTKITSWQSMTSATDMKNWISTKGPLATCFTVYDDFYAYSNGIYSHVSGNLAGGHCVSVVGYNDINQYWICKNSWGSGWGDSGFFCIAYGQVGIDSEMWGVVVSGNGIGGYDLKSSADRAFAFDYDGSGKMDHMALYRPGTGTMWILKKDSAGNFSPVYTP